MENIWIGKNPVSWRMKIFVYRIRRSPRGQRKTSSPCKYCSRTNRRMWSESWPVSSLSERLVLPWTEKNVDREIFKHRLRRDLNFKSNGLGLSKIVRTELENGRFEVLNLSALWCSSGACVSVVNTSILYFLGRENRLSKPNRPWVSCSRIPRPRKRACFGQNREGHP